MAKTLFFEGAGCNGTQVNDVENCRIRTAFKADDGKQYYLELMNGFTFIKRSTVIPVELNGLDYTKDGQYFKFPNMIYVDFCFEIHNGRGNSNSFVHPIDRKTYHIPYTKAGILELVNKNLNCSFTEVVILPWLAGYRVHADKSGSYNLMDDFVNIPARTKERERIYYSVAKNHFNKIYQKHVKEHPQYANLVSKYDTWNITKMTDKTITIRSHTYKQLIDDSERVKTWRVRY